MAKLWYFVRCNVLFVVVFDGKYKPGKLRHGHIPHVSGAVSYDEAIRYFRTISPSNYGEGLSLVQQIIQILARNCIDYVQAPAEAEAECAWLQRLGVVDYVVSDDSDTLVFGATQVLRMFNRVKYFDLENKPVLSSTDYYVTPVHMAHITERTGLSKERLVLVAVLRGGDYSSGVESIGITRAKEIALCGTTLLQDSPRKKTQDFGALPDFARMLADALVLPERCEILPDPYYALKSELDRAEALAAFNNYLDNFLRTQAKSVFGRMATMKGQVHVDDYYALLYFFPLVNRKVFKFTPYSISFGELKGVSADLCVTVNSKVKRANLICSASTIGTLIISEEGQSFLGTERAKELVQEKYVLPRERKHSLKAFVVKLLAEEKYHQSIELARTKLLDKTCMAVLKFRRQKLNEIAYFTSKQTPQWVLDGDKDIQEVQEIQSDQSEEENAVEEGSKDEVTVYEDLKDEDAAEERELQIEVPLSVVRLVSRDYVVKFENRKSPRRSPKKKLPPQKTTLDLIWPGMLPQKNRENPPIKLDLPSLPMPIFESATLPKAHPKEQFKTSLRPPTTKQPLKPICKSQPDRSSPKKPEKGRSPTRSEGSPTKSRRRSNVPLPGQSKVTSFFQPRFLDNPLEDCLFVGSDDQTDNTTSVSHYMSLPARPVLLGPTDREKLPSYSRVSSPELSPSKRPRKNYFSPEVSPVKPKLEPGDAFPPLG